MVKQFPIKTKYLVKPNPVPGTSAVVGRHLKLGHSVTHFPPFVLYKERHQRDVHLIRELWRPAYITVRHISDRISPGFPHRPQAGIYLQGEDGGDGLVVADSVLHVTAVEMLHNSSATGEA